MKMKKVTATMLAAVMAAGMLTGCGGSGDSAKKDDEPSVYYLNFKPEVAEVWETLAEKYTEETLSLIHI